MRYQFSTTTWSRCEDTFTITMLINYYHYLVFRLRQLLSSKIVNYAVKTDRHETLVVVYFTLFNAEKNFLVMTYLG